MSNKDPVKGSNQSSDTLRPALQKVTCSLEVQQRPVWKVLREV